MKYTKPFLTYEQQADLLMVERGMQADRESLIRHLQDVGYYRLSGYWHIFKKDGRDEFWEGTTFDRIWSLYVFDRQFRLVVLDAIERVEVYMRTQLAYLLAEQTGSFGFLERGNLPRLKGDAYNKFMRRCRDAYKCSREPFAIHFRTKYGDKHELPPYWMLVNLMDFGMVVTLYKGAPVPVRQEIANKLGVSTRVLDSWLVTINTVRNICAHHGRLWNRIIGTPPKIPNARVARALRGAWRQDLRHAHGPELPVGARRAGHGLEGQAADSCRWPHGRQQVAHGLRGGLGDVSGVGEVGALEGDGQWPEGGAGRCAKSRERLAREARASLEGEHAREEAAVEQVLERVAYPEVLLHDGGRCSDLDGCRLERQPAFRRVRSCDSIHCSAPPISSFPFRRPTR